MDEILLINGRALGVSFSIIEIHFLINLIQFSREQKKIFKREIKF